MAVINDFFGTSDLFDDAFGGELIDIPGAVYSGTRVPTVALAINGGQVQADSLTWDAVESYGYRSLSATITRADALRLNATQGSRVMLHASAAETLFDGHLVGPPRLLTNGTAEIMANGWALKAEKRTDALPYQTRDVGLWVEGDEPPHSYSSGASELFDTAITDTVLRWLKEKHAYTLGNMSLPFVFWQPGVEIIRYAATRMNTGVSSNFDWQSSLGLGPNGGNNFEADHSIVDGSIDRTIGVVNQGNDLLMIQVRCNTGTTPASKGRHKLTNLRVNAKHPDGTGPAADSWTPRKLLTDVCSILGVDSSRNLASDTLNILPWWSTEGESFLANIETATDLSDDHFGFYEGGALVAGSWDTSKVWTVRNGSHVDLTPNIVHSQVRVSYASPKGKPKQVLATDAAALARYGENTYEVELPDPQADSTLATTIASALLPVVSTQTYTGSIATTEYQDASGALRPYGPRPGDLVRVADWGPGESTTHRITSTSGAQGEPLTLGVEGAEANADRIIMNAQKATERRRKGRKRHRQRSRGRAGGIRNPR